LLVGKQAIPDQRCEAHLSLPIERERNAPRTRDAILDAAERLFAECGYEATSLQEVGAAAGVSRGAPGYFFRSKAALYDAVLDRALAEVRDTVRTGRTRALASGERPEVILAGAVAEYFDFLAAHPNFLRLVEREALRSGPLRDDGAFATAGQEALAAIADELGLDPRSDETAQLLLSVVALCWFPFVHARTVAPAIGVRLDRPADLERRKRHVVALVLRGLCAGAALPLTRTTTDD
jgi:AcrR family transcriptional regulator